MTVTVPQRLWLCLVPRSMADQSDAILLLRSLAVTPEAAEAVSEEVEAVSAAEAVVSADTASNLLMYTTRCSSFN